MKNILCFLLIVGSLVGCRQSNDGDLVLENTPESLVGNYVLEEIRCNEGLSSYWNNYSYLSITKNVNVGFTVDQVFDTHSGCTIRTESTFNKTGEFSYSSQVLRRTCSGNCSYQQNQECNGPTGQIYQLQVSKAGAILAVSDPQDEDICIAGSQTGAPNTRYRQLIN